MWKRVFTGVVSIPLVVSCGDGASTTHIVTANVLNCRAAPRQSSEVLTQIRRGEAVSKIESNGEWFLVDTGDHECWAHSDWLVEPSSAKDDLGDSTQAERRTPSFADAPANALDKAVASLFGSVARSIPDMNCEYLAEIIASADQRVLYVEHGREITRDRKALSCSGYIYTSVWEGNGVYRIRQVGDNQFIFDFNVFLRAKRTWLDGVNWH